MRISSLNAGGGPGSDTTAARLVDPRFYGVQRVDLKAKYGARGDGTSHPLGGIFGSLAQAQAVYPAAVFATAAAAQAAFPTANISNSYTWQTVELDTAAFIQAESDYRSGTAGSAVIGLADNSIFMQSQQWNLENAANVWLHGGRHSRIITGTGTTPGMRVANCGDLSLPLYDLSFSPAVATVGLSGAAAGTPQSGYVAGTQVLFIDNCRGIDLERISWVNYDQPIKWGNVTFGITFKKCAAGANNYGWNWNETVYLNSMEKIYWDDGSLSNNNYGFYWDALYGASRNNSQGGSVFIRGGSIDYNFVRQGVYNNQYNDYAIASFHISGCHLETQHVTSGSTLARIINNGTMLLTDNEICENDGSAPPGYVEVLAGSSTTMVANRINDTQMALMFDQTSGNKRTEAYGNTMQAATSVRPIALRKLVTAASGGNPAVYSDTPQGMLSDGGTKIIFDDPNPLGSGAFFGVSDILCKYDTAKNFTLSATDWPAGSSFRVWCTNQPVTFVVQTGSIKTTFPPNASRLATAGQCANVFRNSVGEWIITGPLVA